MNRSEWLLCGAIALAVAMVLVAWLSPVARPDLCGFDPREMGRQESEMWRSYYDGRWVRLAWQTLGVAHRQYGFSWWDSMRLGAHASHAAWIFRRNTDDLRCLSELESYYAIIDAAAPPDIDVAEAARLELEWWKQRRRNLRPDEYAGTTARLTGLVYGVPAADVLPSSRMRAQAMAYRDARRDGRMTDSDWEYVGKMLEEAYGELKKTPVNGESP